MYFKPLLLLCRMWLSPGELLVWWWGPSVPLARTRSVRALQWPHKGRLSAELWENGTAHLSAPVLFCGPNLASLLSFCPCFTLQTFCLFITFPTLFYMVYLCSTSLLSPFVSEDSLPLKPKVILQTWSYLSGIDLLRPSQGSVPRVREREALLFPPVDLLFKFSCQKHDQ